MKCYSVLTPSKWKCSRWCLVSFSPYSNISLLCVSRFNHFPLIHSSNNFPCILNRGWFGCTLATDGLDAVQMENHSTKLQPCDITINHIERISLLQIRMNEFMHVLDEGYNFLHSHIFVSFSVQRCEGDRASLWCFYHFGSAISQAGQMCIIIINAGQCVCTIMEEKQKKKKQIE